MTTPPTVDGYRSVGYHPACMPTRIQVSTCDDPEQSRIITAAPQVGVLGLVGCKVWSVYHVQLVGGGPTADGPAGTVGEGSHGPSQMVGESAEGCSTGDAPARGENQNAVDGCLSPSDIKRLCHEILVDPVTDEVVLGEPSWDGPAVEVAPIAGVTDSAARELERAAATLGLPRIRAATARRYELLGDLGKADIDLLTRRLLANPTIERHHIGLLAPCFIPENSTEWPRVRTVRMTGLGDDGLNELSRRRMLALDLDEMRAVQTYFGMQQREPTDAELETIAQTWSEHCSHKTFNAQIRLEHTDHTGSVSVEEFEDGLLTLLRRATAELGKPWLRSAFVDNAGIIAFDEHFDLAVKVETHNHPSALEPFGGANTGVGGVVRDVLGVSARPIACTDVLCFGPADLPNGDLPRGVLHPARIRAGVTAGIGDYANKLGLPTVNGAVLYDRGYIGNPLVFCGAVGLLPSGSHPVEPQPGDRIILIGGRTGRDGVRGATFSSAGLDAEIADKAGSAVQIGDPITEKGCIEVVERARDAGLYNAVTDCGAGGLSSAVGEMGSELGATVDLAAVQLKYPGLRPWEIWLSEAQERMVLAVPCERVEALADLACVWNVELSDIGSFTDTGRLVVRHSLPGGSPSVDSGGASSESATTRRSGTRSRQGREAGSVDAVEVVDLPMEFLHHGRPRRRMAAVHQDPELPAALDSLHGVDSICLSSLLLDLLAHPNISSSEPIVRTYDHEVGGGTVVRPFVGPGADGPSDAAVLKPLGTWHHSRAVALAVGINPRVGRLDPRAMALHCIDEAFRNLVAVGADPDRVALLDNFCWGDPTRPDRLGSLVRAVQGCADGALRYQAPFVSGKDSLHNEFNGRAVPGTLLISAVGIVPDLRRAVTSPLKEPGGDLWLVGPTPGDDSGSDRLGGSLVAEVLGIADTRVPEPIAEPLGLYRSVHSLITEGRIRAAHDVSDGGAAVALAEMAIGGQLGLQAQLPAPVSAGRGSPEAVIGGADVSAGADGADAGADGADATVGTSVGGMGGLITALFNEAPGRLVLEAPASERAAVAECLGPLGRRIGVVTDSGIIEIGVATRDGSCSALGVTDRSPGGTNSSIPDGARLGADIGGRGGSVDGRLVAPLASRQRRYAVRRGIRQRSP